jgi:hypothetical protein
MVAPLSKLEKFTYSNELFSVRIDGKYAKFNTQLVESPHLVLANRFLENGVSLNVPLLERPDGRFELDMRKGNLPARWALMIYEFGLDRNNCGDVEVVSYVDKEFDKLNSDFSFSADCGEESHLYSGDKAQALNDFISQSPVKFNNTDLLTCRSMVDMSKFIPFYRYGRGSNGKLCVKKAPYVSLDKMKKLDYYERRIHADHFDSHRNPSNDDSNGSDGSDVWNPANVWSSCATKIFTNECVSLSNDNKKYHCDIGCSEGSFGFPLSSYYNTMHFLFSRKPFEYPGEYDGSNNYHVRDSFQKEELVVLKENLNKMGGCAEFTTIPLQDTNDVINMINFKIVN